MKRILLLYTTSLICFITNAQTTVVDSILSSGIYRSYRLYVPAVYNGSAARPLIINMHGYTSNAIQQQFYSNFAPIADTANFLMVYPQGTLDPQNSPYWNAGISPLAADDLGFLNHLIDSLKAQYNIDLNRVYATGMSNGGFMAYTLACELSNRITAIASVTGSIFVTQYGTHCHPTRPMPVMQIHGTADTRVPYAGSTTEGMMPVDSVVKYWVTKNGCNPTPVFSNVPNINTTDNSTAEHYVYSGGNLGSTVELYKVIGGTHTWPGSPFQIGVTNRDFSASVEIWRFFSQYKLNELTSVNDIDTKHTDIVIYPNPATSMLQISYNTTIVDNLLYEISDVLGNVIVKEQIAGNSISIDKLNNGIYFLSITQNNKQLSKVKFVKG